MNINQNESYERKYSYRDLIGRIIDYVKQYKLQIIVIVTLIILISSVNIITPIIYSKSITQAKDYIIAKRIIIIMALLVFSELVKWVLNYFRQCIAAKLICNVLKKVRIDAFDKAITHDMCFYDINSSGSTATRILYDTQVFSGAVNILFEFISNSFVLFPIMIVCFTINKQLALLLVEMTPFIIVLPIMVARIRRMLTHKNQRSLSIISSKVQETINCIIIAKNFCQEDKLYSEFNEFNEKAYKTKLYWGLGGMMTHLLNFVVSFASVFIVYFGGINVLKGEISIGAWYLFIQSINIFWWPIINISSFFNIFQEGMAAGERVFSLIDSEKTIIQNNNVRVNDLNGNIEFKNVDFSYITNQDVLSDFNLSIKPGENVALVGYSGSGKSSIGKLVSRFYEFQDGELLIDGKDIRSFDLNSYRMQIGIIPQIPFLFEGTVRENIRYASPESSDFEIENAINQIGNGEWVNALPHGLDTKLNEMGRGISMGQKQLISLARVVLKHPKIIIMDEATSSIDLITEYQIEKGMEKVLKNRTALIIAHRLSTIENADRIIVMEKGAIVEQGTHKDLIARNGVYNYLYNNYYKQNQ